MKKSAAFCAALLLSAVFSFRVCAEFIQLLPVSEYSRFSSGAVENGGGIAEVSSTFSPIAVENSEGSSSALTAYSHPVEKGENSPVAYSTTRADNVEKGEAVAASSAAAVPITAKGAVLIEAYSGQVLYADNADKKLPMASVTKTMCLLLWAEDIAAGKLSFDDEVTASSYAGSMTGSVIWLTSGEKMTAGELLKAIVIASANDACVAMAEHTDVTEAAFVARMNKRAKELGMKNTHYVNCVGYDDKKHYSTAYDLALVTAQLMRHDIYREYMLTWLDYLRGEATQLVNTNKMIKWYNGILGGKTGTTDLAGCCLAVCAERTDFRLVAVVLGCENDDARFDSAEALLDMGFSSFEKFSPKIEKEMLKDIDVKHGVRKSVGTMLLNHNICVVPKGRSSAVEYEYTFVENVTAPVKKGQFLGEYLTLIDGKEIFRTAIVADSDVGQLDFATSLVRIVAEALRM